MTDLQGKGAVKAYHRVLSGKPSSMREEGIRKCSSEVEHYIPQDSNGMDAHCVIMCR